LRDHTGLSARRHDQADAGSAEGVRAARRSGGEFDCWPDEGYQAALDRIEREWIKAGIDPNLVHPICWFAPRPA
jgi:hypothetical protein